MNDYIVGVIVEGVIALVSTLISTFLVDFLRERREVKRWKLESTTSFFRELHDPLAPFFSATYKILFRFSGNHIDEIRRLAMHAHGINEKL